MHFVNVPAKFPASAPLIETRVSSALRNRVGSGRVTRFSPNAWQRHTAAPFSDACTERVPHTLCRAPRNGTASKSKRQFEFRALPPRTRCAAVPRRKPCPLALFGNAALAGYVRLHGIDARAAHRRVPPSIMTRQGDRRCGMRSGAAIVRPWQFSTGCRAYHAEMRRERRVERPCSAVARSPLR